MNKHFQQTILNVTGATTLFEIEEIQSLWSGYGKIMRYGLQGCTIDSVVVKHVRPPMKKQHPRGWNTDLSHARKIKSYQVEKSWYDKWSHHCDEACRVPDCLALESIDNEVFMVLEDLDASGFAQRKTTVSETEITACLSWLANFHATFIGENPNDLWAIGTYWHLDTRPDELEVLTDIALKNAAVSIDNKLRNCTYQTFVHGDAKSANFCFSEDGKQVAAVDFQYIGGGCGIKDVAYFIGSCLDEEQCEQMESSILDIYFRELTKKLKQKDKMIDSFAVEREWRDLYPVAWTDFHRFLKGWSPGHWKINSYSERLAREVLIQLRQKG